MIARKNPAAQSLLMSTVTAACCNRGHHDNDRARSERLAPANGNLDGGRVTGFASTAAPREISTRHPMRSLPLRQQLDRWLSRRRISGADDRRNRQRRADQRHRLAIFRIAASGATPEGSYARRSLIDRSRWSGTLVGFVVPRYLVRSTDDGRPREIIDTTVYQPFGDGRWWFLRMGLFSYGSN